ncbi:hypothetical protein ACWDA7_38840 [Streptomyces sp. NPDC001156]
MTLLVDAPAAAATLAAADREPPNHDTLTCTTRYNCRRPACVERARANERARRKLQSQGAYARFADAEPVRLHVQQIIAAGGTVNAIAIRTGLSDRTVRDLLPVRPDGSRAPLKHRMLTENAERLLALKPEDVIPQYVLALGTVRRLQALVADAWPMVWAAPRVGLGSKYVGQLMARSAACKELPVLGTTALKVARGYDELRGKRSTRYGVSAKGARCARALAKTRSWPPTRYWDQFPGAIDDPHFTPDYQRTRREIVAEDAHWLMTKGRLSRADAAERIGVSTSYIDHAFADYPEYAVGVTE